MNSWFPTINTMKLLSSLSSMILLLSTTTTWAALLLLASSSSSSSSSSPPTTTTTTSSVNAQHQVSAGSSIDYSLCNSTPYPDVCLNSLKLSIGINISPTILDFLLQSLQTALSEAGKLASLLATASTGDSLVEKQRGALQDCKDLHQITLSSLQRTFSGVKARTARDRADGRAFLSAALTNKETCLQGLDSASGPLKPVIVGSFTDAYKYVGNCLSMLSKPAGGRRRLLEYWRSTTTRRVILQADVDEFDPSQVLTVAADGSGNFSRITDAVSFAPNNSNHRTIIYIKQGVYQENVEIPMYKTNVVMIGDGSDVTVVTGNRSVADGWTTFRSATVAVSGEGFLARDLTFENSAGPQKGQAVALRVNADQTAVYRCTITGYQDSLYAHSFRQFYRECDIYGTIDFIFGNAAVIFQASNIVSRTPLPGQFTVITAQSRDNPDENTGISIQNCSVLATDELYASNVSSFLGRPWREYSRVVFMRSYIDDFIDPAGWHKWSEDSEEEEDNLYYGEYDNNGPGSGTDDRVDWPGYHIMGYEDASNFTVAEFITGDEWLYSTSFPYDDWI
ncbi:Probable pectinesterase/pectinesterase inhibitor 12 [Dionaea muscipula]